MNDYKIGAIVVVHNLLRREDLNGLLAAVLGTESERLRLRVMLADGSREEVLVKCQNVSPTQLNSLPT